MPDLTEFEKLLIDRISNTDLKDSLTQIRKSAEAIWADDAPRIIQGFTDHGFGHCLRLIKYASKLLNANKGNSLTDEEMYLLIAGIYLHDIGMQCDISKFSKIKEKAVDFGANFKSEFNSVNAYQYSLEEQKEIRNNHHFLTAAWISYSYLTNETTLAKSIKSVPDDLMSDLIDICLYHSKLDISKCSLFFKINSKGRKQLIASLVRFADELDVDKSRVSIETVINFSLNPHNSYYWWLHHLTSIDITDNILFLKVRLNQADYISYNSFVKETYINNFAKKNEPVLDILKINNIPISISSESEVILHEYAPKLPDEIIEVIRKIQNKLEIDKSNTISEKKKLLNIQLKDFPKPKPYFVGRIDELKLLKETYYKSSFIFIEGSGGIGKTQFVAKFIEELWIIDKIVWYECLPTSQPDDVIKGAGFEELLKGKEKTEREKYSAFKDKIEEYDLVVFLDNYQEVKNNTAFKSFLVFINEYLRKGHLIVLGRDNIASPQLQPKRIQIKGLGSDSILHAERLIEYSYPNIKVSKENLNTLCNSLKGYPLAIDLAIYLLSLNVTVDNILSVAVTEAQAEGSEIEKISERLLNEIFTRPDASEEEKEFIKSFSIFRGKIQEKEAISVIPQKIFENASRKLINRNLLEFDNGYFELHPLIREFCYDELINKKEIHYKAANYYIENRTKQWNPDQEEKIFYHLSSSEQWLEISDSIIKFGREFIFQGFLDRLQLMITLVKKHKFFEPIFDIFEGDIAEIKGNWDVALSIFNKAMQSPIEEVKIEGMIKYGEMLFRQGNVKESQSFFERAIEITKNESYKKWHARALNDLGLVNDSFGNIIYALTLLNEALIIRQNIGDFGDIAISMFNVAEIIKAQGNINEALELLNKVLKIEEANSNKSGIARCLVKIGNIKKRKSLNKEALDFLEKALIIFEEIGEKSGIAVSIASIGSFKADLGLKREALELLERSLKICKEIGDKIGTAAVLNDIGLIKSDLGYKEEALKLFEKSLKTIEEIGNKKGIATCLSNIGLFLFENNCELEKSCFYLLKSFALLKKIGIPEYKQAKLDIINIRKKLGKIKFKDMVTKALIQLDDELNNFIDIDEILGEPIKVEKKLGRNDPCHCGSEKKFKYCHGKL